MTAWCSPRPPCSTRRQMTSDPACPDTRRWRGSGCADSSTTSPSVERAAGIGHWTVRQQRLAYVSRQLRDANHGLRRRRRRTGRRIGSACRTRQDQHRHHQGSHRLILMESAGAPRHLKTRRRHFRNLVAQADIQQVPTFDGRDHVTQFGDFRVTELFAQFGIRGIGVVALRQRVDGVGPGERGAFAGIEKRRLAPSRPRRSHGAGRRPASSSRASACRRRRRSRSPATRAGAPARSGAHPACCGETSRTTRSWLSGWRAPG